MAEHPWISIGRTLASQSKKISSYYGKEEEGDIPPLEKNISKSAMEKAESEFKEMNAISNDLKAALKSLIKSKTNVP